MSPDTGEVLTHELPEQVASFGLVDDGRLVVAMPSGVYFYDREQRSLRFLVDPEPGHRDNFPEDRLNDGKVGPDGAFWVGSMHKAAPTAALYRITSIGHLERKVEGLSTSNGLAFSFDGSVLYHSDSRQAWVDQYKLNLSTGELSDRVRMAVLNESDGRPDGGATDTAGNYWSAGVSAHCLNCFTSEGELQAKIQVPLKRPTAMCFGGADMRTLFITSIRNPDDASDLCGQLLSARTEIPGVVVGKFKTT
jgi:sugar lactone lactonase YvrE